MTLDQSKNCRRDLTHTHTHTALHKYHLDDDGFGFVYLPRNGVVLYLTANTGRWFLVHLYGDPIT